MDNLRELFHGSVCFVYKESYIIPRRFTLEQKNIFPETHSFYGRTLCGASITLELVTDSDKISFDYKFFYRSGIKSRFEVYTNGFLTHLIQDCELADEGKLEFVFKKGRKRIEIYLPNYSETGIKEFCVNGAYKQIPKKRTKVLFIGDSITQGGGSKRSAQTYVNITKRAMDYEVLNQGIGGYYCDEKIIKEIPFDPDKIIVAFGTNHLYFTEEQNEKAIGGFFEALDKRYKNKKTLVILPPFYGREQVENIREKYKRIKEIFLDIISNYSNMQAVSAYKMIPHLAEYYMDDFIHPNALGMEIYGNCLVKEIKRIKF